MQLFTGSADVLVRTERSEYNFVRTRAPSKSQNIRTQLKKHLRSISAADGTRLAGSHQTGSLHRRQPADQM
jgi:hypothetical protein